MFVIFLVLTDGYIDFRKIQHPLDNQKVLCMYAYRTVRTLPPSRGGWMKNEEEMVFDKYSLRHVYTTYVSKPCDAILVQFFTFNDGLLD